VWRPGMTDWQPYASVAAAAGAAPLRGTATADTALQPALAGADQPAEGGVPGPYGYGGFWRRFAARLIDSVVLGLFGVVIGGIAGLIVGMGGGVDNPQLYQVVMQAISIVVGVSYEVFFIRKFDATLGKLAMGVKLVRADGSKLSVGRIVGRYFAAVLSALTLFIGYIIAAFDEQKRTLHDWICDTRVVKTR
jgi:uncharacterized RDD family membrane protein YckC